MQFKKLPSADELVAASPSISPELAIHIIHFAEHWARSADEAGELVTYICQELDRHGSSAWNDLRWSLLLNRINNLSSQINQQIDRFARR
ncbi:MAG TPA: hypothetical protein PKX07_16830 [Aggregatilineales bacterium]|jgi:hypothetical protein|nr:hypothetical protein [Aggregatilineales bacterium]